MSNLFFVQTPLQLMVAQQIISEFGLKNNIMLYGYVIGSSPKVFEVYNLMEIDNIWDKRIFFDGISNWATIRKRYLIYDFIKLFFRYKSLTRIINKYQVNNIYLSDINNPTFKFIATIFKNKHSKKIHFFEDGSSHYHYMNRFFRGGKLNSILSAVSDTLFYKPFFELEWGKYEFCEVIPFEKIPIDVRYSLIPYYHETYDVLLHYKPLLSQRLEDYLKDEIPSLGIPRSILFLSSNIYESVLTGSDEYLKVIKDFIDKIAPHTFLYIKFHPREKECDKKRIIEYALQAGLNFKVFSEKFNIPIEIYLNYIKFDEIVSFFTSTMYYNGYLFPRTHFSSLLERYYNECIVQGERYAYVLEELISKEREIGVKPTLI